MGQVLEYNCDEPQIPLKEIKDEYNTERKQKYVDKDNFMPVANNDEPVERIKTIKI